MLTVGHSTLSPEIFLKILEQNAVASLVDIRTIPKSRHNPQFEQGALSKTLAAAGIAYEWFPDLGGLRKTLRELDGLNAGWVNASFRGYADYMQSEEFSSAIDRLLALESRLPKRPPNAAVIMCAEAVPWRCHRSLVGDALLARGHSVEDIFFDRQGTSKRQPHRLTKFARVEGTRVWYPPAELELDFGAADATAG